MIKQTIAAAVLAAGGATVLAGAVLATPGSGVTGVVLARGAFLNSVDMKFKIDGGDPKVIHVGQAQDTVVQSLAIAPNGTTGWHSHPGPVVVVVSAGTLTLYSADDPTCTPRHYSAGESFIDSGQGHAHIARNLSATQTTEILATYFDVPPLGAFRLDAPDPGNCSF